MEAQKRAWARCRNWSRPNLGIGTLGEAECIGGACMCLFSFHRFVASLLSKYGYLVLVVAHPTSNNNDDLVTCFGLVLEKKNEKEEVDCL